MCKYVLNHIILYKKMIFLRLFMIQTMKLLTDANWVNSTNYLSTSRECNNIWIKYMPSSLPHVAETYLTGLNPASLAITQDNQFAYVANSNNYGITGSDQVSVLDLQRQVNLTTINHSSFNEPYRVAIYYQPNDDNNNKHQRHSQRHSQRQHQQSKSQKYRVYVTNSGSPALNQPADSGTVSVIDSQTDQVVQVISGFDGPTAIVISQKNNLAYVSNYGGPGGLQSGNGHTVSVVDLITNQITATIATSQAPTALALSRDNRWLYVACYVDGNLSTGVLDVINCQTNQRVSTITGLSGPFAVALSRNNRWAYVTNFGSNNFAPYGQTVSVINLKLGEIVSQIPVGIQPAGICLSPCDKYAYVSNYNALYGNPTTFQNLTYGEGTVSKICLRRRRVIKPTISIGQTPSTLTISPDGEKLYVCKYVQNTVSAIKLK